MQQPTFHELDTPLAREFAELLIRQMDIYSSINTMKLWYEKYASETQSSDSSKWDSEPTIIMVSLFRDALIQFIGCFGKDRRVSLNAEEVYGQDPNGLSSFQWHKDMRDAYAAHNFGAQRQCSVGVFIDPTTGAIRIASQLAFYQGPLKDVGPRMISFMTIAADFIDAKVNQVRDQLVAFAQTHTHDEINRMPLAQAPRTITQEEARTPRAKLKRTASTRTSSGHRHWSFTLPPDPS
jgi:hypothetical protein